MSRERSVRMSAKEDKSILEKHSELKQLEKELNPITYSVRNELEIPEETKERMLAKGFTLRWVRHSIRGVTDVKNVSNKRKQGYTFVTASEVPEISGNMVVGSQDVDNDDLVINGDLILAKTPIEMFNAVKKVVEEKTLAQEEAMRSDNNNKGLLDKSSKAQVGFGTKKSSSFADNTSE